MNKQVEELMERVRLIDGEIPYDPEDLVSGLSVVPMSAREMEQLPYDTYKKGAEAQLNKVLNDPDLALIDRERELPAHFCECCKHHTIKAGEDFCPEGYCGGDYQKWEFASYLSVIPLAEALKEEV